MKTYAKEAKEETGSAPECTGAVLVIKKVTRQNVKKVDSEYVGCAQYVVQMQIKAPKAAMGMTVFDRIRVGTPEDKEAKKRETWEVSEGGPARLRRLLTRSGTPITDDDEEWMENARDHEVVAPIVKRGEYTNVGLYYREADKDCPEIALAGVKGKPAARKVAVADDEETATDDEPEKAAEVDEEAEEAPKPAKAKAPKAKKPADDDDEDDD